MKRVLGIAKAELQTMFYSPIAWFILIVFIVQSCLAYFGYVGTIPDQQKYGRVFQDLTCGVFVFNQSPGLFLTMIGTLFYYIPLLTMGLISRELSSGSIKLLFSSPVSNKQIILGKYLAVMAYGLIMVFIMFLYVVHGACVIENFDWGFIWISLLGFYLLICVYGAIGLFMSSITSYQIVAALSTLVVLTFFRYVGTWWQDIGFVREITYWLSMSSRANIFAFGLICSEDVIYYITVILLFLTLAVLRLNVRREKKSIQVVIGRYIALFTVIITIAYLSSRPALMCFYDGTRVEKNTLSIGSRKVVKNLKGKYIITTYANIFSDPQIAWNATPKTEIHDMKRYMGQYTRFKPDIKLKYIYYHSDKGEAYANYKKTYPDKSYGEIVEIVAKRFGIKMRNLLSEEEVLKIEPSLEDEGFTTIKIVTNKGDKKGFLRYFHDVYLMPMEREISAGFKRMYTEFYPKVAFVSGHDERAIDEYGDLGYYNITSKKVRASLYNQGFDISCITLDNPIDLDVSIIVIADPRKEFSDVELKNYQDFVDRGGNCVILGEPNRYKITNRLTEQFGVQLLDGRVVKPRRSNRADIMGQLVSKASEQLSYFFRDKRLNYWYLNVTPSVAPLKFVNIDGINRTVVLETDSIGGMPWLELETRNFEDEEPVFNEKAGEYSQIDFPLIVALDRQINGKTQKIFISGDSDFISNSVLSNSLGGYACDNGTMLMGMFEWLSDGVSPIDVRRPEPIDNKMNLSVEKVAINEALFLYILPGLLLIIAVFINIRRKSK